MNDENESKRIEVLKAISPICKVFGISNFDYIFDGNSEYLKLPKAKIACTSDSALAVVDELIGYIFITRWCHHRWLGAFEAQTLKKIRESWVFKEESHE